MVSSKLCRVVLPSINHKRRGPPASRAIAQTALKITNQKRPAGVQTTAHHFARQSPRRREVQGPCTRLLPSARTPERNCQAESRADGHPAPTTKQAGTLNEASTSRLAGPSTIPAGHVRDGCLYMLSRGVPGVCGTAASGTHLGTLSMLASAAEVCPGIFLWTWGPRSSL